MGFYNFNASRISESRLSPQLKHLGVLELLINDLVPGGKDALTIAVTQFEMPEPRKITPIIIKYLNGAIKVPGGPEAIGDLSVTFVDYLNGSQRRVLHQLFDYVYDERSGIGGLKSEIAFDIYAVLFGSNGLESTRYLLYGCWLTSDPPYVGIDYNSNSEMVTMPVTFAVDYVIDEVVNGVNFGSGFGSDQNVLQAAARVSGGANLSLGGFGGSVLANI